MSQYYMEFDCLACQNELFVNNPLDVNENDEHALDFALDYFIPFRFGEIGLSVYGSCLLPRTFV
jgi:hypothetical protein